MSFADVVVIVLAALLIGLGFYAVRYGVLAGLVERNIRKTRFSPEKATGRDAVGYGLLNIFAGMFLMIAGSYLLLWAFTT